MSAKVAISAECRGKRSPDDTWLLSSFRLGVPDEAVGTAVAGCAASASATAEAAAAASAWSAGGATNKACYHCQPYRREHRGAVNSSNATIKPCDVQQVHLMGGDNARA
jgi:hypothetical protein